MWKILGEDAIYIDIKSTFKKRLGELAPEDDTGNRFRQLLDRTEVDFMINGETEENCFILTVPDEYSPEDIQFMADQTMAAIVRNDSAPISVNGAEQKYKIIINNNKEPELIGLRKTPGMSSVEVFKPVFKSWGGPGRSNPNANSGYDL